MKSSRDLIASAKQEIPEASAAEVKQKIADGDDFVLLDIRDNDEYRAGYISSALYISRGMLELEIEDYVPNRDQEIVLYCAGGILGKQCRRVGWWDAHSHARSWKNHPFFLCRRNYGGQSQDESQSAKWTRKSDACHHGCIYGRCIQCDRGAANGRRLE